jgi:hypothetical protein
MFFVFCNTIFRHKFHFFQSNLLYYHIVTICFFMKIVQVHEPLAGRSISKRSEPNSCFGHKLGHIGTKAWCHSYAMAQ